MNPKECVLCVCLYIWRDFHIRARRYRFESNFCLINDNSLIADLHIFVYGRAECVSISLKCTKVILSISNNFVYSLVVFPIASPTILAPCSHSTKGRYTIRELLYRRKQNNYQHKLQKSILGYALIGTDTYNKIDFHFCFKISYFLNDQFSKTADMRTIFGSGGVHSFY